MSWVLLLGAVVVEVVATTMLRASGGLRRRRWIPAVVVAYASSFALFAGSLRLGMLLGVGYAVWSACGVALTALAARILFRERLRPLAAAGIAIIVAGVLLVGSGR